MEKNMFYKLTEIKTENDLNKENEITINFSKVITISPYNEGKNTMIQFKNQYILVKESYSSINGILTNWSKSIS